MLREQELKRGYSERGVSKVSTTEVFMLPRVEPKCTFKDTVWHNRSLIEI